MRKYVLPLAAAAIIILMVMSMLPGISRGLGGSIGYSGASSSLSSGSVDTDKLASDAVTTVKLINDAVDTAKLKSDAVTTAKILDGAVQTPKLGSGSVDTTKLLDGAVLQRHIGPGVSFAPAAGSVDTAKVASGAIDTSKVLDGAIAYPRFLADGLVQTPKLADGAVQTSKILPGAVISSSLINSCVQTAKLAADAVGPTNVQNTGAYRVGKLGIGMTPGNVFDVAVNANSTQYIQAQNNNASPLANMGFCLGNNASATDACIFTQSSANITAVANEAEAYTFYRGSPGSYVFMSQATDVGRINTTGGWTMRGQVTATSSMTVQGYFSIVQTNKVGFDQLPMPSLGSMAQCTDCTNTYSICVATGASVSQWRVSGTTNGCGSGN